MTRIGQILVFLITCFSVLFMGFAVTVHSTRTNWRDKYNAKNDELGKLQKQKVALDQQVKTLTEAIAIEVEKHKADRDKFIADIKDQKANYDRLLADWKQAREDVVKYTNQTQLAIQEATARRLEVDRLREMWRTTQEEKEKALKKQFEITQDFIELTGNHETLTARAKDLEQRNAELIGVLESHGLGTESKAARDASITNPPSVEGVILEVDPQGKFVKISLGSDHGLRRLHRLQVYRVKPQGKFVGTIELTEVDPDKSVGRILSEFKQGNIQNGDLVATRITASR